MTFKTTALLAGLGLALSAGAAFADSASGTLNVTASVTNSCTVGSPTLAFGSYSGSAVTANTNLAVNCTKDAAVVLTLDQGANAAVGSTDAAPARQLAGPSTNFLAYSLYQNSGATTVWGNTGATGAGYTGTGVSTDVTIYGKIAAGQNVAAGSYSDTVTITATY